MTEQISGIVEILNASDQVTIKLNGNEGDIRIYRMVDRIQRGIVERGL